MPWQGDNFVRTDGTRTGTDVWQQNRSAGIKVVADGHDTHDQDMAAGISLLVRKNGGNTATGNLPMGGFRHLNVGNAQKGDEYASVAQVQDGSLTFVGTVTGTPNDIIATLQPPLSSYKPGVCIGFRVGLANTGAVTINISNLGSRPLVKFGNALVAGDLLVNDIVYAVYDGTAAAFQVITPHRIPILPNGYITGSLLADNSVPGAKLADDAVTGAKLLNETVTGAKIADAAVTTAKLAPGVGAPMDYQELTVSGNYTKPPTARWLLWHLVGGGGGANATGGGGGGGAFFLLMPALFFPTTAAYTIGSGGAINADGSNTTVATISGGYNLIAGGGSRGAANTGGGGGAENTNPTGNANGADPGWGGHWLGAGGGSSANGGAAHRGGAGGAGGANNSGGASRFGGGGGSGSGSGTGGTSDFAGRGGNTSEAGQFPGGGGGAGTPQAGAAGVARVWAF